MAHFQYEIQVTTPIRHGKPGVHSSPGSKPSPQYPQALLAPYEASTQQVEAASSRLDLAHSLKMHSHPENGFGQGGMRDRAPLLYPSWKSLATGTGAFELRTDVDAKGCLQFARGTQ